MKPALDANFFMLKRKSALYLSLLTTYFQKILILQNKAVKTFTYTNWKCSPTHHIIL